MSNCRRCLILPVLLANSYAKYHKGLEQYADYSVVSGRAECPNRGKNFHDAEEPTAEGRN